MVQQIIIFLIFILAAAYVARLVYNSFSSRSGNCAKGCGSACSTLDFEKIRQQAEARSRA